MLEELTTKANRETQPSMLNMVHKNPKLVLPATNFCKQQEDARESARLENHYVFTIVLVVLLDCKMFDSDARLLQAHSIPLDSRCLRHAPFCRSPSAWRGSGFPGFPRKSRRNPSLGSHHGRDEENFAFLLSFAQVLFHHALREANRAAVFQGSHHGHCGLHAASAVPNLL
ncbi:hypothetical protein KSP39_PZI021724 [Platanthera zijinensis]|uniref:Uncharacterized protein n=1 Tax=Platanthera zijinensis TaxID=2320716 RepID=A0AAP0AZ73_9ASPA